MALDISPAACRRAARAPGAIGAVVADAWAPLPLADGAFDAVLSIFAPRQPAEFARVLAPGGRLLVVTPLPDHLVELRTAWGCWASAPTRRSGCTSPSVRTSVWTAGRRFEAMLQLDPAAVHDVVSMGPNAFHQDPDALRSRIATLPDPQPVTMASRSRPGPQRASGRSGPMRSGLTREHDTLFVVRARRETHPQPALGRELEM